MHALRVSIWIVGKRKVVSRADVNRKKFKDSLFKMKRYSTADGGCGVRLLC